MTPNRKWFSVQNKAETEPVEILIYDQIGKDWFSDDGIAAKEFVEALKEIPANRKIVVGIDSPGGNVWDGLAIYHRLKERGDKVTTRVDGISASIASVILMAGAKAVMPRNALVMIHRATGLAMGNESAMEKTRDILRKHDDVIAGIYSLKNHKPVSEILDAMTEETWMNGDDAKAFGLVDELTDAVVVNNRFDLKAFKHFPALQGAGAGASAAPINNKSTNIPVMSDKEKGAEAPPATPTLDLSEISKAITNAVKAGFEGLKEQLKPAEPPPQPPVAPRIENLGNPLVEKFQNGIPGAEHKRFVTGNYHRLGTELVRHGVFNVNTIGAGLANSILSSEAVDTMRTKVAALAAFCRKIELSPISKRQVVNVPLISSAGAIQTNPTTFETGDTVTADVAVTVNQLSKSWHVTNAEQNLGFELTQFAPTNAMVMSEGVVALVTALMTAANYGAGTAVGAAANFDSADLPAILALGKNYGRVTLLLDGGHLAYLLPTTRESFIFGEAGAYGFDGGIYKNNLWTGAIAQTCGFVTGPSAIAIASGPPAALPSGEFISQATVEIGAGLSVTVSTWFSRATRALWGSYDIMFGCAVGDATQAEVLIVA